MDGLAMGRERWNGFSGKIQRDILFAPSWRDNLSCSSCHLPSIGAFLNRFPPSSSNCSTYSLQLTRRIVFAALFLHLQRDTSLPLETSVTRDIPFLRCFSSLLPFPFFFLPFALIMYRATLPLSLSVSAIKGKKHLELFTLLAL